MTTNILFLATILVAFASAVVCHVTLAIGIGRRYSFLRGVVALLVPPLSIAWGFASRMWLRAGGCVVGGVVYGLGFLLR